MILEDSILGFKSIFDIIMILFTAISALLGLFYGFIRMFLSMLIFMLSAYINIMIYPFLRKVLFLYIQKDLLFFLVLTISMYVLFLLCYKLIKSQSTLLLKNVNLGAINNFLGLMSGLINSFLVAIIVFTLIVISNSNIYKISSTEQIRKEIYKLKVKDYPEFIKISKLTPTLDKSMKYLIKLLPDSIIEKIKILNILHKSPPE